MIVTFWNVFLAHLLCLWFWISLLYLLHRSEYLPPFLAGNGASTVKEDTGTGETSEDRTIIESPDYMVLENGIPDLGERD